MGEAVKTVLVRVDFNVPVISGMILDEARLLLPFRTVKSLLNKGLNVVLLSHLGQGKIPSLKLSLRQLVPTIEKIYQTPVVFLDNYLSNSARLTIQNLPQGSLILLENLRFHPEEVECNLNFAKQLASLGDFFINEAFSVSHRSHASIWGIPQFLPSELGETFQREIKIIDDFFSRPDLLRMGIVGGAKIETKIDLLKSLSRKVNKLALGGSVAKAFLAYQKNSALSVSDSEKHTENVKEIIETAEKNNCELIVPTDFSALVSADKDEQTIASFGNRDLNISDIGPSTAKLLKKHISQSDMVIWNGPLGIFEKKPFDFGTKTIAQFIARLTQYKGLTSIIGGGDTAFAIKRFKLVDKMTYISTAGGAFLYYIGHGDCPALQAIRMKWK